MPKKKESPRKKIKYSKGFKQLIVKTGIFLLLFVAISYIIGQKVVESSLLYGFKIYIYGGMGYILLFSVVGFLLLYREKLYRFESFKHNIADWIFLVASLLFLFSFYLIELSVKTIPISWINIIIVHFIFLATFLALVIGIFGLDFLFNFYKKFKKEVIYFLIFGIIAYLLMNFAWSLWPYLSFAVSRIVYWMLKLISKDVGFIPPDTLRFGNFAAKIAEACSGVFSIFIFTALYLFILLIDWKKLNKKKAFVIFIPAVLGAFLVNILRVFTLMVVGNYISGKAALGLYHSYTGMIFFLIYFIVFWFFAYKWIKK